MRPRRTPALLAVLTVLAAGAAACGDTPAGDTPAGPDQSDGLGLVTAGVERSAGDRARIDDVVASLHGLAGGLYAERAAGEGNLVLSPYSIGVALGMTANGAHGQTAEEMRRVLHAESLRAYNAGLNALSWHVTSLAGEHELSGGEDVEVTVDQANALFGQADTAWAPGFLRVLGKQYGAGVRELDFADGTEGARELINEWTAARTDDRIPEILPNGAVDPATRLVLVNALSLTAPWAEPFDEDRSGSGSFRRTDGSTTEVEMMTATVDGSGYARGDGWQAVRLPYAGGGLALTVVVPDPGRLGELEARVAEGGLAAMLETVSPQPVELTLPRWEFRAPTALQRALSDLGMSTAFSRDADFAGMTSAETPAHERGLSLQDVHHEAYISVDEKGTEAAAATAVAVGIVSKPQYRRVVVDRPFLFVLHDVEHGTPLFLGRVSDPSA